MGDPNYVQHATQAPQLPSTDVYGLLNVTPVGVGGWLAFFCVAITVLTPLLTLNQVFMEWQRVLPLAGQFPSLRTSLYWESYASIAIVFYGVMIGCAIWNGNPHGRDIARRYLRIRLVGTIALQVVTLMLVGKVPVEVLGYAIGWLFGVSLREIIFFLIWSSYFKKSKRVRNTYGPLKA